MTGLKLTGFEKDEDPRSVEAKTEAPKQGGGTNPDQREVDFVRRATAPYFPLVFATSNPISGQAAINVSPGASHRTAIAAQMAAALVSHGLHDQLAEQCREQYPNATKSDVLDAAVSSLSGVAVRLADSLIKALAEGGAPDA